MITYFTYLPGVRDVTETTGLPITTKTLPEETGKHWKHLQRPDLTVGASRETQTTKSEYNMQNEIETHTHAHAPPNDVGMTHSCANKLVKDLRARTKYVSRLLLLGNSIETKIARLKTSVQEPNRETCLVLDHCAHHRTPTKHCNKSTYLVIDFKIN